MHSTRSHVVGGARTVRTAARPTIINYSHSASKIRLLLRWPQKKRCKAHKRKSSTAKAGANGGRLGSGEWGVGSGSRAWKQRASCILQLSSCWRSQRYNFSYTCHAPQRTVPNVLRHLDGQPWWPAALPALLSSACFPQPQQQPQQKRKTEATRLGNTTCCYLMRVKIIQGLRRQVP